MIEYIMSFLYFILAMLGCIITGCAFAYACVGILLQVVKNRSGAKDVNDTVLASHQLRFISMEQKEKHYKKN